MKIIYNDYIPFKGYIAMNLFGILFVRGNKTLSKDTINHESIHSEQYKDLLYILFLVLYMLEYLFKIFVSIFVNRGKHSILHYAYKSISLEQEAYYNENNDNYLNVRKRYNWFKYIFKMYKI